MFRFRKLFQKTTTGDVKETSVRSDPVQAGKRRWFRNWRVDQGQHPSDEVEVLRRRSVELVTQLSDCLAALFATQGKPGDRYRQLLQGVPDTIFRIAPNGTLLDYHPGRNDLPNMSSTESAGRTVPDIFPSPVAAQIMHQLEHCLHKGEAQSLEFRLPDQGQWRDYEANFVPACGAEVLVTVRDSTRQKRTEQARQQTLRLAAVGTLAAGIAHEINNPVAAVLTSAETALSLSEDPSSLAAVKDCLTNIVTAAQRCTEITRRIKNLAKSEAGGRTRHRVCDVLDGAWSLARLSLGPAAVGVMFDDDLDTSEIMVDRSEIEQVMLSLLENAVKAGDEAGRVHVSTDKTADTVRIIVRDDGCGMTEEQRSRIFDPFFTSWGQEGGMGLGLSTAYRIVKNHDGSIEVDSQPSQGTSVIMELPMAR